VPRHRMHQRIDVVPHWREETHCPCPYVLPKQTPLLLRKFLVSAA
jgi:hypothetical protein